MQMSNVGKSIDSKREKRHCKSDDCKPSLSNNRPGWTFCHYCIHDSPSIIDELTDILTERKHKVSESTESDGSSIFKKYKSKKDGCAETGYFSKHRRSFQSKNIGMEKLRKSYTATKNLPSPEIAIKMNNSKQLEKLNTSNKLGADEEKHVSEINEMVVHRLSTTIVLGEDSPNESGEALLSYEAFNSDIQPLIISHLVHHSDTRRMSCQSDVDRERRRSSFSLRNMDITILKSAQELASSKQQYLLNETNDSDFINNLPKISTMVKYELQSELPQTQRTIKKLKEIFKDPNVGVQKKTTDNWLLILYTTSQEVKDSLTEFDCNLVRLILQHHCIAYEERDIAIKKQQFRKQLEAIFESDTVRVPFVCAKGVSVGGVQVIFVMHKMKLIEEIFKDFIISPEMYATWLYKRSTDKSPLNLHVKMSSFPALKHILNQNYKTNLTKSDQKVVKVGKITLKRSKLLWYNLSTEMYVQPSLLKLVLLRNTIILAYSLLNKLYYEYLPGHGSDIVKSLSSDCAEVTTDRLCGTCYMIAEHLLQTCPTYSKKELTCDNTILFPSELYRNVGNFELTDNKKVLL